MDQVKAALKALSAGGETSKQANAWLQNFESQPESWTHSDTLLREPFSAQNTDGLFYRQWGGKMLHNKIQRYFHQLGPDQIPSLTQSLLAHLFAFAQQHPMEFPVCRYVCLSIAALAVQINQDGVVAQILQWLNPLIITSPKVVLELLIVLPEETHNRHIDVTADQRDAFLAQLTASTESVFGFLATLWPTASASTKEDVLKCLLRWIDLTIVPGSTLAAQPIFGAALDALSDPVLFEAATDVVIVTIQRYECTKNFDVMQMVLPRVVALRGLWNAQVALLAKSPDDDDALQTCRAIARIFAEVGERYIKLIFSQTDIGQGEIIQQLLECSKLSVRGAARREALDIANIPMRFFFDLSQEISCVRMQAELAPLIEAFSPVFVTLLGVVLDQVQIAERKFDAAEEHKELSQDEVEIRNEWRDVIVDCQQVLGAELTMQTMCSSLQASVSVQGAQPWHVIESRLFGMHVIAPYVVGSEASATLLPFVMDLISRMPDVGPMSGTIMELVGRLSKWLACNPNYLPHFMNQLGQALRTSRQSSVAAKALKAILADCYAVPGLPIEQMHELLLETRAAGKLPPEADCEIIEGFRKVIVNMSLEQQGPALQYLIEPIVGNLATSVAGTTSTSPSSVIPNLDRLTSAIKYDFDNQAANIDPDTFVPFFVQSIPILQTVLEVCPTDPVAEKVCRCYKNGIRTSRAAFLPYLPAMVDHLAKKFEQRQFSAYIYAGANCVADYGNASPEIQQVLYQMIWSMSRTFFKEMGTLERFIDFPDVVEEYYYLIVKVLKTCPGPLLSAPDDTASLIVAGITGLQLEHRNAQRGILCFFDELLRVAATSGSTNSSVKQIGDSAAQIVQSIGASLVGALMLCLSGQLPAYAVADRRSPVSIIGVLHRIRDLSPGDFQVLHSFLRRRYFCSSNMSSVPFSPTFLSLSPAPYISMLCRRGSRALWRAFQRMCNSMRARWAFRTQRARRPAGIPSSIVS